MTQVVSSISGLQVYAPSAGYAPTNSADVSAIASGYQVVSSTSTELYAGTAFLTGVNGAPVSASRAGNAANAGMANSAYYDGTGRLISSLPDSATVSAIASSYAESAASGKLDATAQVVTSTGSASAVMMGGTSYYASRINGLNISAQKAYLADEWMHADDKLDASASSSFYTTANESGYADSAYVESQVSGKQDTLTFDWDADSAISSINGSALAGQGGGASIPFTGYYYDSAESATEAITADVTAVSSTPYKTYHGNVVNAYKGITDSMGIHHYGVASFIDAGAEINGTNTGGIPYTMSFAPEVSMWTTADAATGIFAPLQYGTGAGMFMESYHFMGYLKGNEWFVADNRYGYVRGEVHQGRGCRVIAEHTGGSWAALSAKNNYANVTLQSTAYCTAKMSVSSNHAYVQVQRGNSYSKYNSAQLDTDYLKFYNGMATGYLDPEDTASGTAYLPAETEYIYISSIPYWNAKLDSTAFNSGDFYTTANESGFVDSAYVDSSVSGKLDSSASSSFYTTANESGFLTGLPRYISVLNLSASGHVRAKATVQDLYGSFDYAGMYFRSGSQRPYNIGIDNTGTNFYIATAKNGFERIYASSIQSWNGKLDSSASSSFYTTANESGFITGVDLSAYATTADLAVLDGIVSGKQDSSAMTAYVDKSAYDELYSSYTGLSALVSQYSGWFNELSSISAKVDTSAIGVIE